MKNLEKLSERELREIAAGTDIQDLVKQYGPQIMQKIDEIREAAKQSGTSDSPIPAAPLVRK